MSPHHSTSLNQEPPSPFRPPPLVQAVASTAANAEAVQKLSSAEAKALVAEERAALRAKAARQTAEEAHTMMMRMEAGEKVR